MSFEDLTCVQIEATRTALRQRTEAYLSAKGWEHTSQTVGSYWMWFKTVGGRQYGCSTEDAFRIQDNIDREEYADAHPEEFND
jgi:hypothetical protein